MSPPPPHQSNPNKKNTSRRALRLKERLFSDVPTFDTKGAGFIPLPMVLRTMLWFFPARRWMVLTDIYMRASKEGVCWFDLGELGYDMDYGSKGKLRIHLRALEEDHFIVCREEGGREYFAIVDPREAIAQLYTDGKIAESRLSSINEVLEGIGHTPISSNSTDSEEE